MQLTLDLMFMLLNCQLKKKKRVKNSDIFVVVEIKLS